MADNWEVSREETFDPHKSAMEFFQSQGWTPIQAAGIVGNLSHESGGMDPLITGDRGKSLGLAQWNGPRKNGLLAYAREKGESYPSFMTQLEYVQRELTNSEKKAGIALSGAKTVDSATKIFSDLYERPSKPMIESRLKRATNALIGFIGPNEAGASEIPGNKWEVVSEEPLDKRWEVVSEVPIDSGINIPQGNPETISPSPSSGPSEIRNPTTDEIINSWREKVARYIEPSSGIMGSILGQVAVGGPTNPMAIPASALGSMITKQMVDTIRGQRNIQANRIMQGLPRDPSAVEQIQDIASSANEGLAASPLLPEAGGAILSKLRPGAALTPEQTAGKLLSDAVASTKKNPYPNMANPYEANMASAQNLQQEIPGWSATPGEATDSARLIKLQKEASSIAGADPGKEHIAANNAAVRDYIESKIPGFSETGTRTDAATVKEALAGKQARIGSEEGLSSQKVFDELSTLKPANKQSVGKVLETTLGDAESSAWKRVGEKYRAFGNDPVKVPQLSKNLDRLEAELTPAERDVYPNTEVSRIRQMLPQSEDAVPVVDEATGLTVLKQSPDTVPFQDLVEMDKMINRSLRRAPAGGPLDRNLKILKGTVEDAMEADKGNNPLYRQAKKEAIKYYDTFDTGAVEEAIRPGNQLRDASGKRMSLSYEEMGDRFWNPSGADDLTRAIGKESAAPIMENHAVHNLETRGIIDRTTGEINGRAYVKWMLENKETLQKYDLWDKFNTVEKASAASDAAKARTDIFNKSVAAKFLGSEPKTALANALSGKNPEQAMRELLVTVQDDPDAIQGLKAAFKDMIMGQAETHSKSIMQQSLSAVPKLENALSKYDGAMRVLFQNEPDKIKAIQNVREAIDTTLRSQRPLVGGSPDTAPLMLGKESVASQVAGKIAMHAITRRIPGLRMAMDAISGAAAQGSKIKENQMWKVLNQAIYDPELAYSIMTEARMGSSKAEALGRQIKARMSPSLLVGAKDSAGYALSKKPTKQDEEKRNRIMADLLGNVQ